MNTRKTRGTNSRGTNSRGTAKKTAVEGTLRGTTRGVATRPAKPPARRAPTANAGALALPIDVVRVAAASTAGPVRRKNLNVNQGLLDRAKQLLGVKTETEAVALGLGAVIELAEFQDEMLAGFDRLMATGGLTHDPDEERDFSGFLAPAPAR